MNSNGSHTAHTPFIAYGENSYGLFVEEGRPRFHMINNLGENSFRGWAVRKTHLEHIKPRKDDKWFPPTTLVVRKSQWDMLPGAPEDFASARQYLRDTIRLDIAVLIVADEFIDHFIKRGAQQ